MFNGEHRAKVIVHCVGHVIVGYDNNSFLGFELPYVVPYYSSLVDIRVKAFGIVFINSCNVKFFIAFFLFYNSFKTGKKLQTCLLQTGLQTCLFYALWLMGFRIQPTFALVRVVRGDLSWDTNCPIPPSHCMLGLLACSEAYEFGQLGTGLSRFR